MGNLRTWFSPNIRKGSTEHASGPVVIRFLGDGVTLGGDNAILDVTIPGGGFDLHDDVTTGLSSYATDDRMLISDESASGDPNRYATLGNLRTYFADLREAITSNAGGIGDTDRTFFSNESESGAPMRYRTMAETRTFMADLHDVWNVALPAIADMDRLWASDASVSGTPMRFLEMADLREYTADLRDVWTTSAALAGDDRVFFSDESEPGGPMKYATVDEFKNTLGPVQTERYGLVDAEVHSSLETFDDNDYLSVSARGNSGVLNPRQFSTIMMRFGDLPATASDETALYTVGPATERKINIYRTGQSLTWDPSFCPCG